MNMNKFIGVIMNHLEQSNIHGFLRVFSFSSIDYSQEASIPVPTSSLL